MTYEVVISAPNDDLKLKPGLTANITIFTLEKTNVLAVPSKALRFKPNEALLQEDEKIDDIDAENKVWTLTNKVFKAHKVEVGTTNGIITEITSGINAGTEIITDFEITVAEEEDGRPSNPFMPRPPKKDKGGDKK